METVSCSGSVKDRVPMEERRRTRACDEPRCERALKVPSTTLLYADTPSCRTSSHLSAHTHTHTHAPSKNIQKYQRRKFVDERPVLQFVTFHSAFRSAPVACFLIE